MESIGATLKLFNDIQRGFISLQAEANDTLNKIIKGGFSNSEYIKELISKILEIIKNPPTRPPPPVITPVTPVTPPGTPVTPPGTPVTPPTPTQPNSSGSGSQSDPTPAEQRTAALERDIERLNRELEALRNNPQSNNRDADERNVAILRELQEHTTLLQRIRDGQA